MLKTIALVILFHDGYLGGSTTAAYFKDKATCEKKGAEVAVTWTGYGHPASYICVKTKVVKMKPGEGPTFQKYTEPTSRMP